MFVAPNGDRPGGAVEGVLQADVHRHPQVRPLPGTSPASATTATTEHPAEERVEPASAEVSSAWEQARDWAAAEPDRLICITGSLYLQQMLASAGCT